jgi:thiamine phosphate synthase YjbQ (UPF0047 family)
MQRLTIKTRRKREVVGITDEVERFLGSGKQGGAGICSLFILHTTAALTTADLDPGTDLDMLDAFEAMVPKLRYRHPHNPTCSGPHPVGADRDLSHATVREWQTIAWNLATRGAD